MEVLIASTVIALAGISGTLKTPAGVPEPGVTVEVQTASGTYTATTSETGEFVLEGVPEGIHTVSLRKGRYTVQLPSVRVTNETKVSLFWNPGISQEDRRRIVQDAFQAGTDLLNQGRYDAAQQEFLRGLFADTAQAPLWASLALAFVGNRSYEEGLFAARMAMTLSPREGAYPNNVGTILFRLGQHEQAIPYFRLALELNPAGSGLYLYNLAACQVALGDTDGAIRSYQEAAKDEEVMPASGFFYLGQLLARQGRKTDAVTALQRYLRASPNGTFAKEASDLLQSLRG
jgi:tetratricopeptide (TPR) repeat protein